MAGIFFQLKTRIRSTLGRCGLKLPHMSTLFVWFLGLTILVGLTLKDVVPLFRVYHNNNVATLIKVDSKNQSATPPFVSLCGQRPAISMRPEDWNDDGTGEHQPVTATRNRSQLSITLERLARSANAGDFSSLDIENINQSGPVIQALWEMFSCVSGFDRHAPSPISPCTDAHLAFPMFTKRSLDTLFSKLFDLICHHVWVDYELANHACLHHVDDFSAPAMLRSDGFCVGLPQTDMDFNVTVVGGNGSIVEETGWIWMQAGGASVWPFQYSGELVFSSQMSIDKSMTAGKINVMVTYYVEMKVFEGRDVTCYRDNSDMTCAMRCFVNRILGLCGCKPFTTHRQRFEKEAQGMPYCDTALYNACSWNRTEVYRKCESECTIPCEYTAYKWTLAAYRTNEDGPRQLIIQMQHARAPVIEFTVTVRDTPEQFLSSVGAVCNFYLGFSGLAVISAIVLCMKLARNWHQSRNGSSIEVLDMRDIENRYQADLRGLQVIRGSTPGMQVLTIGHVDNLRRELVSEVKGVIVHLEQEMHQMKRSLAELKGSKQ